MNETARMMMQRVYETGFAMDDMGLYLDTHPTDRDALNYYYYVANLNRDAVRAYENQFGPLTAGAVKNENQWTWLTGNWPWEGDR